MKAGLGDLVPTCVIKRHFSLLRSLLIREVL